MERKIGEIFEYNGEWYQCVEGLYCDNCAFVNDNCEDRERITLREKLAKQPVTGFCNYEKRNDRKSVIFKKLEKVGEPVTVKGRTFQKLTSDNNSCKECVFNVPNKACCKNSYIEGICDDSGFWVEIKQNKVDMEEKKIQHYDCFFDREPSKSGLKPFSLEAAKAGKPVCTRDGRKVRIICFDRNDLYPIVALIECEDGKEIIGAYSKEGQTEIYEIKGTNLMMLPEKKEGWVNVYKNQIHNTLESAEEGHKGTTDYIKTIKVSWEE